MTMHSRCLLPSVTVTQPYGASQDPATGPIGNFDHSTGTTTHVWRGSGGTRVRPVRPYDDPRARPSRVAAERAGWWVVWRGEPVVHKRRGTPVYDTQVGVPHGRGTSDSLAG